MAAVFISYRRSITDGHAGRLIDRLGHWYDADAIFHDKASLDAGEAFPERLAREVAGASVVLVLIGPGRVDELNRRAGANGAGPGGAAGNEVDFVRREVEQALARLPTASTPSAPSVLSALSAASASSAPSATDQGSDRDTSAGAPAPAREPAPVVLPLLFGGAAMPAARDFADVLRPTLGRLCDLNAHVFGGPQRPTETTSSCACVSGWRASRACLRSASAGRRESRSRFACPISR